MQRFVRAKIRWERNLLLSLMSIVHEQTQGSNDKDRNLKAKIYYLALRMILECISPIYYIKYQYKIN